MWLIWNNVNLSARPVAVCTNEEKRFGPCGSSPSGISWQEESDFRITRHCLIKLLMLFWPIQLLQHGTPKQHWVYLPTHSVSTSVKGRIHTFEWCVLQFVGFLFPFRLCPNPHLEARSQQLKPSLQNQCETCWSALMCQIHFLCLTADPSLDLASSSWRFISSMRTWTSFTVAAYVFFCWLMSSAVSAMFWMSCPSASCLPLMDDRRACRLFSNSVGHSKCNDHL